MCKYCITFPIIVFLPYHSLISFSIRPISTSLLLILIKLSFVLFTISSHSAFVMKSFKETNVPFLYSFAFDRNASSFDKESCIIPSVAISTGKRLVIENISFNIPQERPNLCAFVAPRCIISVVLEIQNDVQTKSIIGF